MIHAIDKSPRSIYEVDFKDATRHLVQVTLWIPRLVTQPTLRIIFPVWTPGSYMVREYTRHIERFEVNAHETPQLSQSEPRSARRISKNIWEAEFDEANWLRVSYQLYCREMSVRTNWVEQDFGFITGAATFPLIADRQLEPIDVHLHTPQGWPSVATSLTQLSRNDRSLHLQATSFDDLVDSPIAVGDFPIRSFQVGGKQHYLANVGDNRYWDLDRAVADVEKIVTEEQKFWIDVPYDDYWFINLVTESGGGLEHDNSTVLMSNRWTMRRRDSYLNWLALVSHEFFHTWNVRRLRPKSLMTYDYEQEQYTRELWIAEGITSYFDDLLLVWSGLCSRDEYLCRLSKTIQSVQTAPGRLVQGLADASWDTWVKHYRPDENTQNARISYYLKGAALAWLLDSELQRLSDGKKSLHTVMLQLWHEFRHTGYSICDFERLIELHGSTELREWLHAHVRQPQELDYSPAMLHYGLRFRPSNGNGNGNAKKEGCEKNVCDVWIGSDSTASEGRLLVRRVYRGSPSDHAGLNVDDELVGLDGYRLTPDAWPDRLGMYQPGQELDLLISRRGQLKTLRIVLGRKPGHNWQLEIDPAAPELAKVNLKQWLSLAPQPLSSLV